MKINYVEVIQNFSYHKVNKTDETKEIWYSLINKRLIFYDFFIEKWCILSLTQNFISITLSAITTKIFAIDHILSINLKIWYTYFKDSSSMVGFENKLRRYNLRDEIKY